MRHPAFQHQADDFWAIYKRSTCAVESRRSQLLALLAEGKPSAEVLAITRYSYQGANKIVDAYEAQCRCATVAVALIFETLQTLRYVRIHDLVGPLV